MIYALKLLFFVLLAGSLASVVFRRAFAGLLTPLQYRRAWQFLFLITCIAFLSFQAGLFLLLIAFAGFIAARYLGDAEAGNVNAFMLFLLPLPPIYALVGGSGEINYVIQLNHVRTLSIVLLTGPALRLLFRKRDRTAPSLRSVDVAMGLIQIWSLLLMMRYTNLTGLARAVVTSLYDILIPYYVLTRTLKTTVQLREAASYFMLGCVMVASVACLESLTQHNLYAGLQWVYGLRWESTVDLRRGGYLRVESATPQTIVLASVLTFGLALWTWLNAGMRRGAATYAVYGVLLFGLVSTWSRGPWLGAALLCGALLLQRWVSPRTFGFVVIGGLFVAVFLKAAGVDEAALNALTNLFGNEKGDLSSITYRRELFDATLALIKQSPWVGVPNWQSALSSFRQGEGLIDIVNTYLIVMINSGVIGLVLFLTPFVVVLYKLLNTKATQRASGNPSVDSFAPVFVALILSMLFIIFTVANISVIPSLLGLCVAFPVAWLLGGRENSSLKSPRRRKHGASVEADRRAARRFAKTVIMT